MQRTDMPHFTKDVTVRIEGGDRFYSAYSASFAPITVRASHRVTGRSVNVAVPCPHNIADGTRRALEMLSREVGEIEVFGEVQR